MSKCYFTVQAKDDLRDIAAYIARDNRIKAKTYVRDLQAHCKTTVAEMPLLFRERYEVDAGVRICPFGKYLIIFKILEDGVRIDRILHGARDVAGILEETVH